ncbi:MAG: hypothetical protein ABL886_11635 [Rhodoglobus sp.]
MVARAVNALRGRWENLWSSEPPCLVRLVTVEDVLDKVVYAATNPVKDHLVERVHHWPGVNGLSDLLNERTITVRRPRYFFAEDGVMPEEVTLELGFPPELGDPDRLREAVRRRVADVEETVRAERCRTGGHVLGRRGVLHQSWRDCPASVAARRGLRPRIAARNKWARIEALQRDHAFQVAYHEARLAWLAGQPAIFPPGTYWLRRFAAVPVAAA